MNNPSPGLHELGHDHRHAVCQGWAVAWPSFGSETGPTAGDRLRPGPSRACRTAERSRARGLAPAQGAARARPQRPAGSTARWHECPARRRVTVPRVERTAAQRPDYEATRRSSLRIARGGSIVLAVGKARKLWDRALGRFMRCRNARGQPRRHGILFESFRQ